MSAMTHAQVRLSVWLALTAAAAIAVACGATVDSPADQPAPPSGSPTAQYLANAAVLVTNGGTKVVFDPLFRNDFGSYERVPASMERALFAGEPPFDGLDAVFISHYHEDHFRPSTSSACWKRVPTCDSTPRRKRWRGCARSPRPGSTPSWPA